MECCDHCGALLPVGRTRPRVYCSNACRQAAYRQRKATLYIRRCAENRLDAGTATDRPRNTPAEASVSFSEAEIRNAASSDTRGDVTDWSRGDGAGFWLWVDPRREVGYDPIRFDLERFLVRAMALFQSKDRWSGQFPNTVRAHPQQVEGLELVARALGLRLKADPLVAPGSYRLGVESAGRGSGELVPVESQGESLDPPGSA